ncbi:hypothetical protein C8J56DRAFT_1170652 [Mycena floridula]|nr:hypothetical protein C8J56DRAFT_1170652 [Mycena floridula]
MPESSSMAINFLVYGGQNMLYYRSESALTVRFSYIPAPLLLTKSMSLRTIMFVFFCSPSAHEIADSWIPNQGLDLTVIGWTCAINRFLWIFIG